MACHPWLLPQREKLLPAIFCSDVAAMFFIEAGYIEAT